MFGYAVPNITHIILRSHMWGMERNEFGGLSIVYLKGR